MSERFNAPFLHNLIPIKDQKAMPLLLLKLFFFFLQKYKYAAFIKQTKTENTEDMVLYWWNKLILDIYNMHPI